MAMVMVGAGWGAPGGKRSAAALPEGEGGWEWRREKGERGEKGIYKLNRKHAKMSTAAFWSLNTKPEKKKPINIV